MVTDSFALWRCYRSAGIPFQTPERTSKCGKAEFRCCIQCCENVISSTDQADVISGRDGKLAEMITEKIGSSFDSYGIKVKGGDEALRPSGFQQGGCLPAYDL